MKFIELYAGMASVSLYLAGGHRPPVSRIGAKTGYAKAIVDILDASQCDSFMLVDVDLSVVQVLTSLVDPRGRAAIAKRLRNWPQSRQKWDELRASVFEGHDEAARWLYVTAASRGGIGGFKGLHKLRPSVNGFIPTIAALAKRVDALDLNPRQWKVLCAKAGDIQPHANSIVYIDPPYKGRQGYLSKAVDDVAPEIIFERWVKAGSRVGLSEGRLLKLSGQSIDLTNRRRGQFRRSLTRDHREYLYVDGPNHQNFQS